MSKILMKVDGSCYPNPGNMAIGIVIYKDGELVKKISETIGYGTNNIAEYKALIRGLEEAKKMNPEKIEVYCDSQLVVKQLNKIYRVRDKNIIPLVEQIEEIVRTLPGRVNFLWNRRDNNFMADNLAKKAILTEEKKKREKAAENLKVERKENYFLVSSSKGRKSYKVEIDTTRCECADFSQRALKMKLECKHLIAVRNYLQKEEEKRKLTDRPRLKVLVLSTMVTPQVWRESLEKLNQEMGLNLEFIIPEGETRDSIKKYLPEVEVIVGGKLNEEDLNQAKKLKLFQVPFAGVDELNFALFKKFPEIYVSNVHANKTAVSEHAFALLLALAKKVVNYDRDLRKGKWHGFSTKEPTLQLEGKNLGIIGLGSIGWEIAKKAKSFGMKVYALKNKINEEDLEKKVEAIEFLGEAKDLLKVIEKADFIIVALPLTSKTRALIGGKELELMQGKYLINIARGEIIEEEALFIALEKKVLAGAAIDTWYQYPSPQQREVLPSKYDFHKLDNVVMSPHTAGYTDKALEENIKSVFDNVVRIYYGELPENRVDPELEY